MKNFFPVLITLCFLICNSAFTQIITIGTGTSLQSHPFNYFSDYGRSAMVYTTAEVGNASSSKTIYKIKFYSDVTSGFVTAPTKIYVNFTLDNTESSVPYDLKISGATLIYSGTPTWTNGWNQFNISSFTVPAGFNLEVVVEANAGTGAGGGPTSSNSIRYTTGLVQHQVWLANTAPPTGAGSVGTSRPNIQLDMTPPAPDMVIISQAPTGTQYFSHGTTGSTVPSTINIYNNSAVPTSGQVTVRRTIKPGSYNEVNTTTGIVAAGNAATINFSNFPFQTGITYTVHDSIICPGEIETTNNAGSVLYNPKAANDIGIFYTNQADADSCAQQLDATGYSGSYDLYNMQSNIPSLSNWNTVFVLFGRSTGWTDFSRDSMITYMNNASPVNKKTICVFGADLGFNFGNSTNTADSNFYRHYLHAKYTGDNWTAQYPDRHFRGVGPFGAVINDTTDENLPDLIQAQFGGRAAFMPVAAPDTTKLTGIYFATASYNELYVSISYESIHSPREPVTDFVSSGTFDFLNTVVNWAQVNGGMLPVELSYFNSSVNHRDVTLSWSTMQEINNSGFDIERSVSGTNNWTVISNIAGHGTSFVTNNYTYTDRGLSSGRYVYRLKQNDFNGNFRYYDLQSEIVIGVPVHYEISQNYPNPFNPSTNINYHIPFESKVEIKLFDIAGREVQTLVNETQFEGYYTLNFNASLLASGVYFYQIVASGTGVNRSQKFEKTMKMVLVK